MAPAQRTPNVAPRSSGCAALGAAVGEVQGQQALAEGAVGRRLIARRVVGADASRDALYDQVVVRPEEEWDRVSRCVVLIVLTDRTGTPPDSVSKA